MMGVGRNGNSVSNTTFYTSGNSGGWSGGSVVRAGSYHDGRYDLTTIRDDLNGGN